MTPRAFSFNSPHGACPTCQGLGSTWDFDPARVVPGRIEVARRGRHRDLGGAATRRWSPARSIGSARSIGIDLDDAVRQAAEEAARPAAARPEAQRRRRRRPSRPRPRRPRPSQAQERSLRRGLRGPAAEPAPPLRRRLVDRPRGARAAIARLRPCPDCDGDRLRPESRAVRVKGQTIAEYVSLPISDALRAFESFQFTERENLVAGRLLREIRDRAHASSTTSASAI